jgi:ferredoxin
MARPIWFVELLKKTFPNINFLAKLTKIPFIGKFIELLLFKGDSLFYLPSDKVIPIGESIENQSSVIPSQVVDYFIENAGYIRVMNFCICRDSNNCKNYPIELGCMFLGEAARDINPKLSRELTKEEAFEHVRKCRDAGLIHLIGRNKLDTVWLNVKPGKKLLTICNCCECCCLWRIIPHLKSDISNKVHKMPGVEVSISDQCVGCGTCVDVCFADAIHLQGNRAYINQNCKACGRCVDVCPRNAIKISVDTNKMVENSINKIKSLVDVS